MADVLLRFLHISDTHYCPPDYERPPSRFDPRTGLSALLEQIRGLHYTPDFIVHTGDVAYDPHELIYSELRQVMGSIGLPIYYIPGNHDHHAALQTVLMGREMAQYPLYHAADYNGVRLLFLDSNGPDAEPPSGHVTEDQIEWLREQLSGDDERPALVFVHHPVLKTHTSEWFDTFMMTLNGEAVHAVLAAARSRVFGVFFGHVHQHISFHRDGVLYSAVKSSWTQFYTDPDQTIQTHNNIAADPGYALVTVTTEGTFIQRFSYRVGLPDET